MPAAMISSSVYSLPASLWAEAPKVLALIQLLGAGPQFQARSLQHGAHAAIQQDGIGPVKQFIRLHR